MNYLYLLNETSRLHQTKYETTTITKRKMPDMIIFLNLSPFGNSAVFKITANVQHVYVVLVFEILELHELVVDD